MALTADTITSFTRPASGKREVGQGLVESAGAKIMAITWAGEPFRRKRVLRALTDARVAKLADAPDLGSGPARGAGSIPVSRTKKAPHGHCRAGLFLCLQVSAVIDR